MSQPFLKLAGVTLLMSLASLQVQAASSDDFVDAAIEAGIAEVVTSNLAQEKSQNADIKKYAQQMVTDHTKANQQLGEIARKLDISVPDEAALTDKVKKMILEWREASFDRSYVNNQVDAHEKAVELFKKESTSSDKPELKAFASEKLPTLEHHLEQAKALQTTHGK
ncbi:DUF4142 domain-containing protein [Pseudomonas sp. SWI6]|uniref:DUF4142 domain-containing protein n=1 Tax=Pseudomonas taiwanensis TaxID=470150 RepID=A0ABR6V1Q4_9PSED|nr:MULTISPECIES: DUF4142 domain-containing protein [Pseudomonas]AGZ35683.1 lipoprotein [Pseudomonas sp. VLB120]AVD82869.1 DUF4142 domain-containing protein [Pseudomonas sp. SWI6]AVD89820.1 DUF4142 domain-containing protein [Pseudomonas sp. SWI44]MBC3474354.1 DUF4142 domain-containing protein [Pseudomonas taiwanensis]MBC3489712.1 DUF4142 domain-containing protein [Pseudomonas taiwanensis]